jgi:low affinity Fe/Cu permease
VHTFAFAACFLVVWFGAPLEKVLLVLTTAVSLEAIYMAIFIQMAVNQNTQSLEEVEEDIPVPEKVPEKEPIEEEESTEPDSSITWDSLIRMSRDELEDIAFDECGFKPKEIRALNDKELFNKIAEFFNLVKEAKPEKTMSPADRVKAAKERMMKR